MALGVLVHNVAVGGDRVADPGEEDTVAAVLRRTGSVRYIGFAGLVVLLYINQYLVFHT